MATDDDVIQRDLGRLEGTVAAQGEKLKELDAKMDTQTSLLQDIKAHLEREKGAKKARSAIALGAASFFGWLVSLAWDHFKA
jgi:hypothetical protein